MIDFDVSRLPESAEDLRKYIIELHKGFSHELLLAQEEIALLRHKIFGRMSEKFTGEDAAQAILFNEAEITADADSSEETENETESIPVAPHRRKKRGRKQLPTDLPREERIHDITDEDKNCGCGAHLVKIGEETSEELEVIPAQIKVLRHIRLKYACKACAGTENLPGEPVVKIDPVLEKLIPRSIATAGLLAFIATGKFVDGLPFSRQEKQYMYLRYIFTKLTFAKIEEDYQKLLPYNIDHKDLALSL